MYIFLQLVSLDSNSFPKISPARGPVQMPKEAGSSAEHRLHKLDFGLCRIVEPAHRFALRSNEILDRALLIHPRAEVSLRFFHDAHVWVRPAREHQFVRKSLHDRKKFLRDWDV